MAVDAEASAIVHGADGRAGERQVARAHLAVAADADEDAVRAAALADPNVKKFIGTAAVRKVIIVPGKLVNVVV